MRIRLAHLVVLAIATLAVPPPAFAQPAEEVAGEIAGESREILVMLHLPPTHYRPNRAYSGRYGDIAAQTARTRLARRISRENGLELMEGWPMPLIGVDCFQMRVPVGRSVEEVLRKLAKSEDVIWVQPLHVYWTMAASGPPDDPLFPLQPTAAEWHLASLHQIATGKGVKIAVIDSKVDEAHPDLAGQVATSRDFASRRVRGGEKHGTGIAGVIGARSGNGIGIVGVAPDARMMALRACSEGSGRGTDRAACNSLALAKALHFAIDNGADVINLSLSGPEDRLLRTLIAVGLERNIAIVTAFDPRLPDGGFPASHPGVLRIADKALLSVHSNVYRAPGRDIPTTAPGGKWGLVSGSSFATAQVSGLLALVKENRRFRGAAPPVLRAKDGVVNACATVVSLAGDCDCSCATEPGSTPAQ